MSDTSRSLTWAIFEPPVSSAPARRRPRPLARTRSWRASGTP